MTDHINEQGASVVSFTHEQNSICSQKQMNDIPHEHTIICRQLFAGHVVGSWPMKRKKHLHRISIVIDITGSDSEQVPAANAVDSSPPPHPSELPPPYIQQPGYQAPPSYEVTPGYQGPPAYQTLPGYPAGQVYQGVPVGYVVATQPSSYVIQPTSMQDIPPDYQGLSWFSCLCCCWPLGIVAILKSNEVKSSLSRGDFHSARIASNSARNFAYAAIGIGVGFIVMYIIAMILVFTIVASSN